VSEEVGEYLNRVFLIPKDKIVLIPDAVEVDEFKAGERKFDPEKPIFLFIGRLFRTKGIEFAIEGLAKLQKEMPGLEFLIYGKQVFADDYRKWQKMVKDNKWDFVKFMGPTQDVPAALKSGDIFVLPSKSEGFGMAVLEAAAASKPLIGTRTGVIPEVIKEGENGYFVDYGDSNQIYETAKQILDGRVETFGERSAKMVENKFSVEKVAEMYYNLYLQILRGNNEKQ
jgi:glycosyltransferase involved in cell wall biosynthesis